MEQDVAQTNLNALTARDLLPVLVKSMFDDLKPSGANAATSMSLYAPMAPSCLNLEPAPTMSLARAIQPLEFGAASAMLRARCGLRHTAVAPLVRR
jgi:hypothetical protein